MDLGLVRILVGFEYGEPFLLLTSNLVLSKLSFVSYWIWFFEMGQVLGNSGSESLSFSPSNQVGSG